MRIAHFDCFSGISGDMTLAALIDAGVNADAIRDGISSLGLPLEVEVEKVRKGGFSATQVRIQTKEETGHRFLPQVEEILCRGRLSLSQRELALRIFRRLAQAESKVHGIPLEKVHFHEVGGLDSIADIAGSAIGLDLLGVDRFTSRSVPTGTGMVKCAHGLMPVPAPGTAELLRGVPLAASPIKSELTTPTGAAILTTVVDEWIDHPLMTIEQVGYGSGRRDFHEQPNLLRLFIGTTSDSAVSDQIWVLETNLDDVPAEVVGYCFERLQEAGALDVYYVPIYMKKNRPGILLSVLANESAIANLEDILFRETGTLGIRRYLVQRHKMERQAISVPTRWGLIEGKLGWRPQGKPIFSPEYESCARVARQSGIPLRDVFFEAQKAYSEKTEHDTTK